MALNPGREFLAETQSHIEKANLVNVEMLKDYVADLDIHLTYIETVKNPETNEENKIIKKYKSQQAANIIINYPETRIIRDKDTGTIWCFTPKQGIYSSYGADIIRLIALTKSEGKGDITYANNVAKTIEALTPGKATPSKKIAVKNGILEITADKVTIAPFSQDEFITNKLTVTYNPDAKEKLNAKGQNIQEFFKEVCPDDHDLLQEWSGYHLIRDMPYHKLMWLFGPKGRNAKGTWARIIQGTIGYENFSNLSAEDLTGKNEFALASLDGKLGNISPEPNSDIPFATETIQSLTGADYIDTKIKYVQKPLKLRNIAKSP